MAPHSSSAATFYMHASCVITSFTFSRHYSLPYLTPVLTSHTTHLCTPHHDTLKQLPFLFYVTLCHSITQCNAYKTLLFRFQEMDTSIYSQVVRVDTHRWRKISCNGLSGSLCWGVEGGGCSSAGASGSLAGHYQLRQWCHAKKGMFNHSSIYI